MFKKRAKGFLSLLLSVILIFSAVVPVFSVSGIEELKGSPESRKLFVATEGEINQLEELLLDFVCSAGESDFTFKSEETQYKDGISKVVISPSGSSPLYNRFFPRNEIVAFETLSVPDSFKDEIFEDSFWYKYPKKNIDWVLRNILNVPYLKFLWFSPDDMVGKNFFYDDEYYYVLKDTEKRSKDSSVQILQTEKLENNKYVVKLSFYFKGIAYVKYAVTGLKELDGKRLWSVFYFGDEAGVENACRNENMEMYVDNNSFSNTTTEFISIDERTRYYLNVDSHKALLNNKSENMGNLLSEQMIGGWKGADYGISASIGLYYNGTLDKTRFKSSDTRLYADLSSPVNDLDLRDVINYCQLSQFTVGKSQVLMFDRLQNDGEDTIKRVLQKTYEKAKENKPFLINCQWKNDMGFVANTFVGFEAEETLAGYKITAIDPDNPYKHIYIIIEKDFSDCRFAQSYYDDCKILSLSMQGLDGNSLNFPNNSEAFAQSRTLISLLRSNNVTIRNEKGLELKCENGEFSGDMPFTVENIISNGCNYLSQVLISVPNSENFTVETNDELLDITISGSNGVFCGVEGTNIKKLTVDSQNITAEGSNMTYSISSLSKEEGIHMVNLRGGETKVISFKLDDTVTVKSERKQTVRIALLGDNGVLEECDYFPQDSEYMVTQQLVTEKIEDAKDNHIKVLIFFICFAAVMGVVVILIIYLIMKKRVEEIRKSVK